MMRVLVIEDELTIGLLVRTVLERDGYDVTHAATGTEGIDIARRWAPDLVVLDLMLPDVHGRDVARRIRATSDVPIVMLTALGRENDRIEGFDAGADDYMVKPFSAAELAARIRAVTRRTNGNGRAPTGPLRYRDLCLDPDRHRVLRGADEIVLTKREFEILRLLMQEPGKVIPRSVIAHTVWGRTAASAMNLLDVHMSSLRRKLGDDPTTPAYIETVRGEGFRLIGGS